MHEGTAPAGERGETGRVWGGGGGDLTQPPSNFSKFLVAISFLRAESQAEILTIHSSFLFIC